MGKPWEDENCDEIFGYFSMYPVGVAAALWCGIPPNEVHKYLEETHEVTPGIYKHPTVKCLEAKCRAMQMAINDGNLPASRENGIIVTDHIAPARRHVSRQHLKDWISKAFPNNKPNFLFDEVEQKTHTAINADSYLSLQADRDALRTEVERLNTLNSNIINERDSLRGENNSLRAIVNKGCTPDPRSETTYLNIISGLKNLLLSTSPAGRKHSIFESQAAIIDALIQYNPNVPGISETTLEQKFADANRSLASA